MRPAELMLSATWAARDSRYSRLKYIVNDDAIEAVRLWRTGEAQRLGSPSLIMEARRWTPPPRVLR